jgi:glucose-1-phosphate thymidylyltransferase
MRAIILAAGYATRLHPLTLNQPKPLLKVGKKPIIEHILDKIEKIETVGQVFVVTNDKFYSSFLEWKDNFDSRLDIEIVNDGTLSNEDRLGAIGDINFVIKTQNITSDLLVVGGDNLFEDELSDFVRFFKSNGTSILLNDVKCKKLAKLYGIVSLNHENKITSFIEKPEQPESTLASTLIYALKKEHLSVIKETIELGKADHAGDFIAHLSQNNPVFGKSLNGKWFDIGSIEQLKEAEEFMYQKND